MKIKTCKQGHTHSDNRCKQCVAAYNAAYGIIHAAKIKVTHAAWHARNADTVAQKNVAWRALNADVIKSKKAAYRAENADKIVLRSAAYYTNNPEKVKAAQKMYRASNLDRHNASRARYRASKLQATPAWANKDKIEEFYYTAQMLGMHTGEFYHVDHIIPLKSKLVCGLHCEANLQVLLGVDNLKKHNRHVV